MLASWGLPLFLWFSHFYNYPLLVASVLRFLHHSFLFLQDFSIFRQIEPTEYIDDLFELRSKYGTPMLEQFAALVNKEMFWVVTEVCSEHNPVRRMKIIKQFIKVASTYCQFV